MSQQVPAQCGSGTYTDPSNASSCLTCAMCSSAQFAAKSCAGSTNTVCAQCESEECLLEVCYFEVFLMLACCVCPMFAVQPSVCPVLIRTPCAHSLILISTCWKFGCPMRLCVVIARLFLCSLGVPLRPTSCAHSAHSYCGYVLVQIPDCFMQ